MVSLFVIICEMQIIPKCDSPTRTTFKRADYKHHHRKKSYIPGGKYSGRVWNPKVEFHMTQEPYILGVNVGSNLNFCSFFWWHQKNPTSNELTLKIFCLSRKIIITNDCDNKYLNSTCSFKNKGRRDKIEFLKLSRPYPVLYSIIF